MTPALTNDQKLKIVFDHREYIKAETEARFAEHRKQVTLQTLSNTVDKVGIELGLEKGKYTINLDRLILEEIAPAKE